MLKVSLDYRILNGYFVGYKINQISQEFDLLRFGDDSVINIELKSKLEVDEVQKTATMIKQMHKNHYYLKALSLNIRLYTYINHDDILYEYNPTKEELCEVGFSDLIEALSSQNFFENIDLDKLFEPKNYLVSPFNKVERLIAGEYFLTNHQQQVKSEIFESLSQEGVMFFCLSANAGTGKTLLTYDIAKEVKNNGGSPVIIHCANLNEGHIRLNSEHNWSIVPIKNIKESSCSNHIAENTNIVIIDEAQRVSSYQLELIIQRVRQLKISAIFAYDTKQFLLTGEDKNIYEYLREHHSDIIAYKKSLTDKIRTNKSISSFIVNLFEIGKSNVNLNYSDISIEYHDNHKDAQHHLDYLVQNKNWQSLTFSNSLYTTESISSLSRMSATNAHNVIGQEFDRIVFVMDSNFRYNIKNKLESNKTYYSISGMLYQITTRAISEMKIIVVENHELYEKLLEIKTLILKNEH